MKTQLETAIVTAMRAKDAETLGTLRMLKAAINNAALKSTKELTGDDYIAITRSELKKRQDAFDIYIQNNRPDLAAKEENERTVLNKFLPAQLTREQVADIVQDVIGQMGSVTKKDMGKIMAAAKPRIAGGADGKTVSEIVQSLLV